MPWWKWARRSSFDAGLIYRAAQNFTRQERWVVKPKRVFACFPAHLNGYAREAVDDYVQLFCSANRLAQALIWQ
jgi:hypothetical protein